MCSIYIINGNGFDLAKVDHIVRGSDGEETCIIMGNREAWVRTTPEEHGALLAAWQQARTDHPVAEDIANGIRVIGPVEPEPAT